MFVNKTWKELAAIVSRRLPEFTPNEELMEESGNSPANLLATPTVIGITTTPRLLDGVTVSQKAEVLVILWEVDKQKPDGDIEILVSYGTI